MNPCRASIFHILIKSQEKFPFWGSYTLIVALKFGVKIGTVERTSSTPNYTTIGAMCLPCGAKSLKISLSVT